MGINGLFNFFFLIGLFFFGWLVQVYVYRRLLIDNKAAYGLEQPKVFVLICYITTLALFAFIILCINMIPAGREPAILSDNNYEWLGWVTLAVIYLVLPLLSVLIWRPVLTDKKQVEQ